MDRSMPSRPLILRGQWPIAGVFNRSVENFVEKRSKITVRLKR